MSPVSQLLLRNLSDIKPDAMLCWVNPMADEAWQRIKAHAGKLSLWCQDYRPWSFLDKVGATAVFADFPAADSERAGHYILSLPRSKQRLDMLLGFIHSIMPREGKLWLPGENNAGIRSATTSLAKWFGAVQQLDSARHCRLFEATLPRDGTSFRLDDYRADWQLDEEFGNLSIHSWPGVFAHGKLDDGTRMLLEHLPGLDSGQTVLDFGCGCGVISARLAALQPELDITMADIDAMALRSAQETMKSNQLEARIHAGDGLEGLAQRFDLVVTNPPFHQGYRSNSSMSMQLLDQVRNFLNPRGQLLMVANRHIPYRKWLDRVFGRHEVVASNSRFQVLHAVQSP